jgi:putrescine---pyruvate transaminase
MLEPRTPGFLHIDAPDPYRFVNKTPEVSLGVAAANALEEAILREGPETVAAFIAEPIQGAGGVIIPPADYFARIREICTRHDVLFIADDVITGFGRTGRWFGADHWGGLHPDLMVTAKGLTSGYFPLGAVLISDRVTDMLDGHAFRHGFTYNGHPTGCAVALENLAIIEREGLIERARELGEHLLAGLRTLEALPAVSEARGFGLMAGLELAVADAAELSDRVRQAGVIVRATGQKLVLSPPLVIERDQIDQIVEVLGRELAATEAVAA